MSAVAATVATVTSLRGEGFFGFFCFGILIGGVRNGAGGVVGSGVAGIVWGVCVPLSSRVEGGETGGIKAGAGSAVMGEVDGGTSFTLTGGKSSMGVEAGGFSTFGLGCRLIVTGAG